MLGLQLRCRVIHFFATLERPCTTGGAGGLPGCLPAGQADPPGGCGRGFSERGNISLEQSHFYLGLMSVSSEYLDRNFSVFPQ